MGIPAVNNYYEKFKTMDKSVEKGKHKRQSPMAYLKKCEDLKILPSPFGMVSLKGSDDMINLKSFRVGNQYAGALGKGLKLSAAVSKVNLAENRLSPFGGLKILQGINQNI